MNFDFTCLPNQNQVLIISSTRIGRSIILKLKIIDETFGGPYCQSSQNIKGKLFFKKKKEEKKTLSLAYQF